MTVIDIVERINHIRTIMGYVEDAVIEIHHIYSDSVKLNKDILDAVYLYLSEYKDLLGSLEVRGLPSELS